MINIMLVGVIGFAGAAAAASTSAATSSATTQVAVNGAVAVFAPTAQPQEKSFLVAAPAEECAALHVKAGCQNRVYVGVGPVSKVATPTSFIASRAVSPNLTMLQTSGWDEICFALGCSIWHMKETAVFDFNSAVVTSVSNNCYDYGGIGVSFQVNLCDSVNNGTTSQSPGGGVMYDEDYTLLTGIASGMPVDKTYWMKIYCNVDGQISFAQN